MWRNVIPQLIRAIDALHRSHLPATVGAPFVSLIHIYYYYSLLFMACWKMEIIIVIKALDDVVSVQHTLSRPEAQTASSS